MYKFVYRRQGNQYLCQSGFDWEYECVRDSLLYVNLKNKIDLKIKIIK